MFGFFGNPIEKQVKKRLASLPVPSANIVILCQEYSTSAFCDCLVIAAPSDLFANFVEKPRKPDPRVFTLESERSRIERSILLNWLSKADLSAEHLTFLDKEMQQIIGPPLDLIKRKIAILCCSHCMRETHNVSDLVERKPAAPPNSSLYEHVMETWHCSCGAVVFRQAKMVRKIIFD